MKKTICLLTTIFFLFSSFGTVSQAQETTAPSAASTNAQEGKLYLDFKGAALINVLMVLSELSGINFVAGKEVANREVNMVLDDVTVEGALDAIGRGSNVSYDYFPDRNLYLFRAAADKEDQPPLVTRVFKLYYIRASELREIMAGGGGGAGSSSSGTTFTTLTETKETGETSTPILKIVESILSERGRIKVDDRSNSLVVTDSEDRVKMIEQAIAELDRPVDQVLIKVVLIETFEDLDRFLGIEWGGNTTSGQEGTLGLIEGASAETRFPFNVNNYGAFTRLFGKTDLNKEKLVEDADAVQTEGIKNFTDLDIRFRALQTAGKLKVIAKPKILVLDNHPALIKITTSEAIGSQTTSTAAGGTAAQTSTTAERTETGTSLRVTPLINTENRITLTIEPAFVTAVTAALSSSFRDPTVRAARTTLMVNSGQTIVMGGLLSSQQTNNVRKLPILGDIPYIGEIFTRRTTQVDDRELMLFITPVIVRDPSEVQPVSVPDYRDRFDDLTAPFWKWKRKNWYKKLKEESKAAETPETTLYIPAREQLMDETMVNLAREQGTNKIKANKPPPSKATSREPTKLEPPKPADPKTPSSIKSHSAVIGVAS